MALITHTLAGLANGVSQQPADLRFDSQGEAQVNMVSSLTQGTYRRPPMEFIAGIVAADQSSTYVHTINRDTTEKYIMVVTNGIIKVFDREGNSFPVIDEAQAYYYLKQFNGELEFKTIADTTFVLNKSVTAQLEKDNPTFNINKFEGLIYVKKGDYSTTYSVFVDDVRVASYTTSKDDVASLKTDNIANILNDQINGSGISATRQGNVIKITQSSDFALRTEDSQGNRNLIAAKDKIQKFTDLPPIAFDGFTLEVTGDRTSSFDNYYVRFVREGSTGSWEEVVKPDQDYKPRRSTMPIQIVRYFDSGGDVFFRTKKIEWLPRSAGDPDSVPSPSFIGQKISGMFFYQNRLGFITSENIVLSKTSKFFDFFPTTATDTLDNDPIDVAISSNKVSNLYAAIPTSKQLLLFADNGQFSLSSGEAALTPSTVRVDSLTSYETNPEVRPVVSGNFVYFPTNKDRFAGVNRFFMGSANDAASAEDITINVPRYLEGRIKLMETSSTEQVLCCVTDLHPSRIYVFKFIQTGQENQQASWSFWDVGANIKKIDIETGTLNLVVSYGGTYSLQRITLEEGIPDQEFNWKIHLDNRVRLQGYVESGKTYYDLPDSYEIQPNSLAVRGEGFKTTGASTVFNYDEEAKRIELSGEHGGTFIYLGQRYDSYYTFTHPVYRDEQGNAINQGRLQIRDWTVEYINTGKFDVEVQTRDTYRNLEIDNRKVSQTGINFSEQPYVDRGKFKFLVGTQAQYARVTVKSREAHPLAILSAHWRGTYTSKAGRV